MPSNAHTRATLQLLKEADENGIEGASERIAELEAELEADR